MAPNKVYTIFDLAEEFLNGFDFDAPSKLPDIFVDSRFPPTNIRKLEDNSLEYEFAVAGIKMNEIDIQFDNDYLVLNITPEKKEEEKIKYRQIGIKRSKTTSKFLVPVSHYDVEKATAKLENGILTISVPTKEVAKPKTVKIEVK